MGRLAVGWGGWLLVGAVGRWLGRLAVGWGGWPLFGAVVAASDVSTTNYTSSLLQVLGVKPVEHPTKEDRAMRLPDDCVVVLPAWHRRPTTKRRKKGGGPALLLSTHRHATSSLLMTWALHLNTNPLVREAGANGFFSSHLALSLGAHAIAFEPQTGCLKAIW